MEMTNISHISKYDYKESQLIFKNTQHLFVFHRVINVSYTVLPF